MDEFKSDVAKKLNLSSLTLYGRDLSLSEVIAQSNTATNSIDIMEAFAYAIAKQGWEERLTLPAFTLNHSIDEVMKSIEQQLN